MLGEPGLNVRPACASLAAESTASASTATEPAIATLIMSAGARRDRLARSQLRGAGHGPRHDGPGGDSNGDRRSGDGHTVRLVLRLLNWLHPLISAFLLAVYGPIFAVLVKALIGRAQRRAGPPADRRPARLGAMPAGHYEVLVDDDVADDAARLLGSAWANASPG